MKFWLAKNSEIPVREQLLTQITLGIISGDLPIGDKMPSTREIARRFNIHSNTVSSVYRALSEQGLLEFKKGSGFYVRQNQPEVASAEEKLEKLINELFHAAENLGFSPREIRSRLQKRFAIHPPEYFLVVESDAKLRDILIEEISAAIDLPVFGIGFEDFLNVIGNSNAIIAALNDEKPKLEKFISNDKRCIFLKPRSVPDSMKGVSRPSADDLIAIVSGWEKFTLWAKTILIAANIEPENLIVRSPTDENWRKAVQSASMIICDSLTAKNFPDDEKVRVFRIIADSSRRELAEKIRNDI